MPFNQYSIDELLDEMGEDREWLAHELGVTTTTIDNYADGTSNPTMKNLDELYFLVQERKLNIVFYLPPEVSRNGKMR